jgi:hypothetical protein
MSGCGYECEELPCPGPQSGSWIAARTLQSVSSIRLPC